MFCMNRGKGKNESQLETCMQSVVNTVHYQGYTVEPLDNHIGTDHFERLSSFGDKMYCHYIYRLAHRKVSFIQRCPYSECPLSEVPLYRVFSHLSPFMM